MLRPLCAVFAPFLLVASVSEAQENKSQSPKSTVVSSNGSDATIISLLQQSHHLGQQLPFLVRITLLPTQVLEISELRADLGREWANELFALSFQGEGEERLYVQSIATGFLIRLNPDRALELLHSVNTEEPGADVAGSPAKMQLAIQVFDLLIDRDGVSALPTLEQEAELMGSKGHYPYAALGYAANQATLKDWGRDNQHAIRVLQSFFDPAFARYSHTAHSYPDDLEFGKMLQVLAGGLPFDSVQPALHMLVKNLLATDTRKYQFEADVYTNEGKSAKVQNAIDAALLSLGSLINRDSELAQQLGSTRPELQRALEYTKGDQQSSIRFGPGAGARNEQSSDSLADTRMDAFRLSHVNPEAAIAKAEQLPDDKRASTLLEVARTISGDQPERAAELITEAQRGNEPADDEKHLDSIVAQAFVAAAQNKKDELDELLKRGFELASREVLEQQRIGSHRFPPDVGTLVQIGIQNDPELTIAFIENLSATGLKAGLLLQAASTLSMGRRLPLSSRPQITVEKADN
jgi:hypothetical protein